jgi:hypothetical protein
MKIRMFIEDGQDKRIQRHPKGIPSNFAGKDAPIKAARYLIQKYQISEDELEKQVA